MIFVTPMSHTMTQCVPFVTFYVLHRVFWPIYKAKALVAFVNSCVDFWLFLRHVFSFLKHSVKAFYKWLNTSFMFPILNKKYRSKRIQYAIWYWRHQYDWDVRHSNIDDECWWRTKLVRKTSVLSSKSQTCRRLFSTSHRFCQQHYHNRS